MDPITSRVTSDQWVSALGTFVNSCDDDIAGIYEEAPLNPENLDIYAVIDPLTQKVRLKVATESFGDWCLSIDSILKITNIHLSAIRSALDLDTIQDALTLLKTKTVATNFAPDFEELRLLVIQHRGQAAIARGAYIRSFTNSDLD